MNKHSKGNCTVLWHFMFIDKAGKTQQAVPGLGFEPETSRTVTWSVTSGSAEQLVD